MPDYDYVYLVMLDKCYLLGDIDDEEWTENIILGAFKSFDDAKKYMVSQRDRIIETTGRTEKNYFDFINTLKKEDDDMYSEYRYIYERYKDDYELVEVVSDEMDIMYSPFINNNTYFYYIRKIAVK